MLILKRPGSQKSAFSNILKPQSHQLPSKCLVALMAVVLLCDREQKGQYFPMAEYVPQKYCTNIYHSSVPFSRLKLLDGYNFSPFPKAKFLFHSCQLCRMWQWKLLIDPAINRKHGKQKGQNNYKNRDSTKEKEMICQTEFSRPKPSAWSQVLSNETPQHSHASWAESNPSFPFPHVPSSSVLHKEPLTEPKWSHAKGTRIRPYLSF